MRHKVAGRQLGRNASHRHAMFRNMSVSLILTVRSEKKDGEAKVPGRIVTTLEKAKSCVRMWKSSLRLLSVLKRLKRRRLLLPRLLRRTPTSGELGVSLTSGRSGRMPLLRLSHFAAGFCCSA